MKAELCAWLHETLAARPLISYPFNPSELPTDGIYFFYESGEFCSHDTAKQRIVRIGTHKDGNFRSRIAEHFLLNEQKMSFTVDQPPPHDRSIFRKHIGRAFLNKSRDPYLSVWDLDFTTRKFRDANRHLRDIKHEVEIEAEVTRILRKNFSFRFIEIPAQSERMGQEGLERALIGTFANCGACRPSAHWLGTYSPNPKIRDSGLWLIQHLRAPALSDSQVQSLSAAIERGRSRS